MPLIYSIDGNLRPYPEPGIAPVGPVFQTVLESQIAGSGMLPGGGGAPGRRGANPTAARDAYERPPARDEARKPVLTAGQVMTSPARSLSPEASMAEAKALMSQHRFRHVPVVSRDGGVLVGILSDRDVLRHAGEETPVSAVMTGRVLTATPSTPIREVARVMLEGRIGALPILNESGHLLGILTTTDLLRAMVERAPIELWA